MIKSKFEWILWGVIGFILLGGIVAHYVRWILLPDGILVTASILFGVYIALLTDTIFRLIWKK